MNNKNQLSMISIKVKSDPKLKAEMAKALKPDEPNAPAPITMASQGDFSAWAVMKPMPAKTFGKVLDKWRRSKTQVPNVNGYWAAYKQGDWAAWIGCGVRSFQSYINELVLVGLVERSQHHHGGNRTLMFYRPTPLALQLCTAKPEDWTHLGTTLQAVVKRSIGGKWTQLVEAHYPDLTVPKLSPKQNAQLKLFEKACPSDTAKEVLIAVVKDWTFFTGTVKAKAGVKMIPAEPNIDFLLVHVEVAVNFTFPGPDKPWETPQAPAQAIAPKPKPEPATTPLAEPKATWEQIQTILSGDEKDTV